MVGAWTRVRGADQGLSFDVTTLLNRRRVLQLLGVGAGTLTLAACTGTATTGSSGSTSSSASTAASDGEIPEETAGPYPGDGSNGADVLEQSGIGRSDIRSSFGTGTGTGSAMAAGVPMTLTLALTDLSDDSSPMEGAAVHVWHCDRDGAYSLYSEGLEDENHLRGVQVADADGEVTFTSVFPACYSGRWLHIHFEVYSDVADITDSTEAIATSQVALPKAACDVVYATTGQERSVANLARVSLSDDDVFGDDDGVSRLAAVTGSAAAGYAVSLDVPIDPSTEPGTSGSTPGSGVGGTPPSGAPQ